MHGGRLFSYRRNVAYSVRHTLTASIVVDSGNSSVRFWKGFDVIAHRYFFDSLDGSHMASYLFVPSEEAKRAYNKTFHRDPRLALRLFRGKTKRPNSPRAASFFSKALYDRSQVCMPTVVAFQHIQSIISAEIMSLFIDMNLETIYYYLLNSVDFYIENSILKSTQSC